MPPFERTNAAHDHTANKTAEQAGAAGSRPGLAAEKMDVTPTADAVTSAADEATMAAVMQEVQEIGATNPAAQQALLAELYRSKPSMWPLVVQQFRSTLAYHDQLTAKPMAVVAEPSDLDEQMPQPTRTAVSPAPPVEPPSATFGNLADPRRDRPDPAIERLFASATPANMPAPSDSTAATMLVSDVPRTFEEDARAKPIDTPPATEHTVVPASALNSDSANANAIQPALYRAETTPLQDEAPRDWKQHVDLAIDNLEQRLKDGPHSTAEVNQLVSLRLMRLLAGRTEDALEPIPGVASEEQDYWSSQIFALATILDHHTQPDDKRRAAAGVNHLDEAVGHLRELSSLTLRNVAFCKNVYGFGAYDPLDTPTFSPGERVSLYVEVENYHSESTEKGYSTTLGSHYELVDRDGKRVSGGEFPAVDDVCRSRRRDFHIQYGLVLPKNISPGKYKVELVLKDRQSDKIGHASTDFEISTR